MSFGCHQHTAPTIGCVYCTVSAIAAPLVPPVPAAPKAGDRQVGGDHYKRMKIEQWDFIAANDLDYFQGNVIKYVVRWKNKNGIEDLEKARHYLDRYIEEAKARAAESK